MAERGNMYHWKFRVIKVGDRQLNIGIVTLNECIMQNLHTHYWGYNYGYSYVAGHERK